MTTQLSGEKLPRAGGLVDSSVEAGEANFADVPASWIFVTGYVQLLYSSQGNENQESSLIYLLESNLSEP